MHVVALKHVLKLVLHRIRLVVLEPDLIDPFLKALNYFMFIQLRVAVLNIV